MQKTMIHQILAQRAESTPQRECIKDKKTSLTYREVFEASCKVGNRLKKAGVQPGDRVGILLDKSYLQVISLLGVLYGDAVFVVINPVLQPNQVLHILRDCDISLILSEAKYTRLLDSIEETGHSIGMIDVKEIYESEGDTTCGEPSVNPDDISNIIYTSGSTGLPKGIVITHRNLLDGARIVSRYLNITENDRILALLPFNFDYGLNQLTSAIYTGASLVLFQYFMPSTLLKIINDEKITGLAAVPPIWASVFNEKLSDIEKKDYTFPNLRYITNSGGKIPVPVVKKIRRYFNTTDLFLMYGLTEAFRSTFLDPGEVDNRPDSMGKAIPDVQVEVVDAQGNVCQPGEEGELIHSGACIARGYWNDPEKTSQVYRDNPLPDDIKQYPGQVVYSGDIVKKDEAGFLYFVGRKDNMIKTGGYRVSPTEVEEVLMAHGNVAGAVVFGLPDDELGQKIRAVLLMKEETPSEELLLFCKKMMPNYLVPRELFQETSFPKTASGKFDRTVIQKENIEQYGK